MQYSIQRIEQSACVKHYGTYRLIGMSKRSLVVLYVQFIGWFYLSQGLGELQIEEKTIRCISMKTPIGIVLEGCEEGGCSAFSRKGNRSAGCLLASFSFFLWEPRARNIVLNITD